MLHAERYPLTVPIDVEDLHIDILSDFDHLRRVGYTTIAHIGDVEQPVHTAEVDERAEVRDILHDAGAHLTNLQLLHELIPLGRPLGLEDHAPRHDDVAATFIQLDDLEFVRLPKQLIDIGHPPQRDLAPRQKRVDTHQVHHNAAFDLLDQRASYRFIAFVCRADLLPHAHEVGFFLRQDDRAVLVLQVLEEDLDFIAGLDLTGVLEFVNRHRAFGLEADVENDMVIGYAKHFRADDLTLCNTLQRALVEGQHFLILFVGILLVAQVGANANCRLGWGLYG